MSEMGPIDLNVSYMVYDQLIVTQSGYSGLSWYVPLYSQITLVGYVGIVSILGFFL
jgi:hypothetical protein